MNPLNPERFMIDENLIEKDYDAMRRLLPSSLASIADMIEDICDRLEYSGSFIYDETPDKTTLLTLTDKVCDTYHLQEPPTMKDIVQALLSAEILYRRCRYYRKKKMFD